MKIHVFAAIFIVFLSLFFNIDRTEMLILLFCVAFVFICELLNTVVEVMVDIITDKYHPLAKVAKDIAAGAVLVSALTSVFVAYFLFYDKVSPYSETLIIKIAKSDAHITFIILIMMLIFIVAAKSLSKKGTPFSGGTVSGHSALAFSMSTVMTFLTKSSLIMVIGFFMAFLVAQSRVEGKIHTFLEVFLGALLGVVITTLIFQYFLN